MALISKPFGGYKNILEIDDIHFEDAFLSKNMKEYLKVSKREEDLSLAFNMVASKVGMKDTRWARVTIIMFFIWTMCTSIVCFQKADFLNVSYFSFCLIFDVLNYSLQLVLWDCFCSLTLNK